MRLIVNGKPFDLPATTLAEAVDCFFAEQPRSALPGERAVATALNGRFVPRGRRGETVLAVEDRIEILAPMQGG